MIYLILTSVFLGALGQILVKYGAVNLTLNFSPAHFLPSILSILKNIPVMAGIISYGFSFLLWIKVLSKVELSYVLIMIFSYFFFKENITPIRIVGVALIMIGVVLVARS